MLPVTKGCSYQRLKSIITAETLSEPFEPEPDCTGVGMVCCHIKSIRSLVPL